MPERALIVRRRALEDVLEIFERIAVDQPEAAVRFERSFRRQCEMLIAFPYSGRAREFRGRAVRGLRSVPLTDFTSWLVFYRVRRDAVDVVRVLHGARDLRRALKDRPRDA